ncbi:Zn-dependent hydrolase [Zymobacter sp. IVIA_12111.31 C1]|uniref:Zn-dependent hydrolase n=1 Tax=Zymobacter sp. IVIA_12111.31 C1 TaxID=3394854 RepID=UPI0039C28573
MKAAWTALATRLFDDIATLTRDPDAGITRECYADSENRAIHHLCQFAHDAGLTSHTDRAGNVVLQRPDDQGRPALWCGSHFDSVPQGGNYDGLAGIIAGLLCLKQLHDDHIELPYDVRVIGLRGEESPWFGKAYIGSRALSGGLTEGDLALTKRGSGITLADSLSAVGADVEAIRRQEWLIDPQQFAGYLEVHIEQADSLEHHHQALGVVPGIRGNVRHNLVHCIGEDGHSGAVPREERHDAVFAVSELISAVDRRWREWVATGRDLVVTVGMLGTDAAHHSVSRIPGDVSFSLEMRSLHSATLEAFYEVVQQERHRIETERQVRFDFDKRIDTPPAAMHAPWVAEAQHIMQRHGLDGLLTPSGAGHDAAVFANAGIPSIMLFVRNQHGSHNPHEAMRMDDFIDATAVLYDMLQTLSQT